MRKNPDSDTTLASYHDLMAEGEFGPESVRSLIEVATRITFGDFDDRSRPVEVAISNLRLYDVFHSDTGKRRFLNQSYGNVPVYETLIQPINRAPIVGRLVLSAVKIQLGGDLSDVDQAETHNIAEITGTINIDDVSSLGTYPYFDAIKTTLDSQKDETYIFGDVSNGRRVIKFGNAKAVLLDPDNNLYTKLVLINSFQDYRVDDHGKEKQY
jgi:hypothetical protein